MATKGKRKEATDCGSDGEEAPPKKKSSTAADSDNNHGDIIVCEIGKNRRVSVRSWQGKVVVDIREYYDKNGKLMPGKKGISLSMDQWKILRDHADKIDAALAEKS